MSSRSTSQQKVREKDVSDLAEPIQDGTHPDDSDEDDTHPDDSDEDEAGSEDQVEPDNIAGSSNLQAPSLSTAEKKLKELLQGKSDIGGKNKKETGGHKFWDTQPVPHPGEQPPEVDGYIEPSKPRQEVRQDPSPLPEEFMWSNIDITDPAQLRELHEFLSANYVEDDSGLFRFQYSVEFLSWALMPPGFHKDWHVSVRANWSKKLVAFISAVPIRMRVRENQFDACEVNFLCVHKSQRSKRLAPVLIKEVTRQCQLQGVSQALYTAAVLLPTPVSSCRYFHRCLNIPKLVDVDFTDVPSDMTMARMIRVHKVPDRPRLLDHGLREMADDDVPQVADLYARYMQRFDMVLVMSHDEVRHRFLGGRGAGPRGPDAWKTPRSGQVVWTYVVEDPKTKRITDFWSFYSLPSTVIRHPNHNVLNTAYLYYYATATAFEPGAEAAGRLKQRLEDLIGDALTVAEQAHFDVFNGLTLMDNVSFLRDMKFGQGDVLLNFYLYNWRTAPLAGVTGVGDTAAGKGVGVVSL
ncbi:N-myristoyl transferase [Epithele typhae]|uniref:N-myristoyl transferase n=1 Tax=Epithele typhae TaxID=378194 RepID=UPI0020083C35|nr:N-myristoyl transferase [Epithele typhae]KAH9914179.1 N-myristoyl transferase [Epithele typhae]